MGRSIPIEQRLKQYTNRRGPNECWEWTASLVKGYGQIWRDGKQVKAHRVAWELENGPIPEGLLVRHTCGNPKCVNPNHLILGTPQENMDDKYARNRHNHLGLTRSMPCESNPNAKLNWKIVEIIRSLIRTSNFQYKQIAPIFGVSNTLIRKVSTGEIWPRSTHPEGLFVWGPL